MLIGLSGHIYYNVTRRAYSIEREMTLQLHHHSKQTSHHTPGTVLEPTSIILLSSFYISNFISLSAI